MNTEDIIRMARESGLADSNNVVHCAYQLEHFASLVAAQEREECAKVCNEQADRSEASMNKSKTIKARDIYSAAGQTAHWMAAAIRARGEGRTPLRSGQPVADILKGRP